MEVLGDVGQVESCFGPIGDGVSIGAREVHGLRGTFHWLRNCFGRTRWYLGDEAKVEAHFGPFGDSVNPDVR
jgi:hypothetical protein